jgi:Tol biopolymer transport system component
MRSIALACVAVFAASACDRKALFPPPRSNSGPALPPPGTAPIIQPGATPVAQPLATGTEAELMLTPAATDLARVVVAPGDQFAPALSPDSASLLLEEPGADGRIRLQVRSIKETNNATVISAETVESRGGAWTPDGTNVVYLSGIDRSYAIVRSGSMSRSAPYVLLSAKQVGYGERVAVSPNGQHLCIEVGVAESRSLARLRMDGTELKVLFEGRAPSFSPDGRRIAFVRTVAGYDQVFTALAESGGEVVQLTRDAANHRAPKFAPNGRYVTFSSNAGFERYAAQGGSAEKTWNIHAIRVDGSALVGLTDGRFTSVQPFWGANGKIYFSSNAGGNFDIYVLTPTGDMGKL